MRDDSYYTLVLMYIRDAGNIRLKYLVLVLSRHTKYLLDHITRKDKLANFEQSTNIIKVQAKLLRFPDYHEILYSRGQGYRKLYRLRFITIIIIITARV